MGNVYEQSTIESFEMDALLILALVAELHAMAQRKVMSAEGGIILFVEEDWKADEIARFLMTKADAKVVRQIRKETDKLPNYLLVIHKYKRNDNEERIDLFLDNPKSVPVLLICGIIPSYLRGRHCILKISNTTFRDNDKNYFRNELEHVREYVRKNPDRIWKLLERFETSKKFQDCIQESSLRLAMELSLYIYEEFYREFHTEEETIERFDEVSNKMESWFSESLELEDDYDILDTVSELIIKYVSTHEIQVCSVRKVEGKINSLMKERKVILYDADFYYIPDEILKSACNPVLEAASYLGIKERMREDDVLICNRTAGTNYTTKKAIVNAYGEPVRERFLKIRRQFLVNTGDLLLEEMRGGETYVSR